MYVAINIINFKYNKCPFHSSITLYSIPSGLDMSESPDAGRGARYTYDSYATRTKRSLATGPLRFEIETQKNPEGAVPAGRVAK